MSTNDSRLVSDLFADALNQFSKLVRNELLLARAEISVKMSEAMTAVGLLVSAALFLIPTLVVLLAALATWMVELGTRPSVAHLIAGAVGLVITGILAGIGMSRLKASSLVPERTLDQLQRDVASVKEHI
jgi:hypothetical protein